MKVLLFLFGFVLCVLAQRRHVCFPEEYTTNQVVFIPGKEDLFVNKIFSSIRSQKERVDFDVVIVDDKPQDERLSFVFDFTAKKWYEIVYTKPHNVSCTVHDLKGDFKPACLVREARRRGEFVLGGTMLVEDWIEKKGNETIEVTFQANVHIPLRTASRGGNDGYNFEEYWDFFEEVHHDAFILPDACRKSPQIGEASTHGEALVSIVPQSPLFRSRLQISLKCPVFVASNK